MSDLIENCTPEDCSCIGHRYSGVHHIVACCGTPHIEFLNKDDYLERAAEDVWNKMYTEFQDGNTFSILDKQNFIPAFIIGAKWANSHPLPPTPLKVDIRDQPDTT